MKLRQAVSLWNFSHYAQPLQLEEIAAFLREKDLGLEIWPSHGVYSDLFQLDTIEKLKPALNGVELSVHTRTQQNSIEQLGQQIAAAKAWGAEILVLHSDDYYSPDSRHPDLDLIQRSVEMADQAGVKLALENGQFGFLNEVFTQIEGVYFCLDIGHVYLVPESLQQFLEAFSQRIVHLHFHDAYYPFEKGRKLENWMFNDHHLPGTGIIDPEDWTLLFKTLERMDFEGTAVLELRPSHPFQAIQMSMDTIQQWLQNTSGLENHF